MSWIQPNHQVIQFISLLRLLLQHGLTLSSSLEYAEETVTHAKLKKAVQRVEKHIQKGELLSQALQQEPLFFSNLLIALVEVGENTGNMRKFWKCTFNSS